MPGPCDVGVSLERAPPPVTAAAELLRDAEEAWSWCVAEEPRNSWGSEGLASSGREPER